MKIIGILGGMSAASTLIYYRELCEMTRARLGGLHSPKLLIRSLDFAAIETLQLQGGWRGDSTGNQGQGAMKVGPHSHGFQHEVVLLY